MGRKIWIVGIVATVLFAASALIGFGVEPAAGNLQLHLLGALGAGTLVVFCQLWIGVYLALTARLAVRAAGEAGLGEEPGRRAGRLLRRVLPWAVPALVATVAVIVLGERLYSGALSALVHQLLGWAALALQVVALAVEKGALDRHEELMEELGRRA